MSKPISQCQLINKLNHLNFRDKPLYVNFSNKLYHRALSIKAKPQPCQDDRLTCLWQQDAGSVVDHPDCFCFKNILIPDGKKFLVAEPDVLDICRHAIRLILPETCRAEDARSTRRHSCRDINVYVTQNGALFYGSMIDFSAFSFRVRVQTRPPQTFDWIDTDLTVNVILFDGNKTLYSGDCRIIKQTYGHKDRYWVLETLKRNIRRFRAKEFRSDRHHMVPLPTINFSHPLSKQTISLDVLNLSGSGLAVEEEYGQAVLFPGLIIPELEIRFGDGSYATCTAQIIYSQVNDGDSAGGLLKCGIAILDVPIEDHIKLYSGNANIARHFIYQKSGRILGHVAMLRFYQRTWLIHHHAAIRSASNKSGLMVLNQIGLFANDSHRLHSSILQVLAASIDARDPLTAGHSEKVTEYALGICDELILSNNYREMICVASLLHDYGKIGVPDSILKKPGRLSKEEYEKVKTHAKKTQSILDQINFEGMFSQVPEIAVSHHEKIDGSGYPNGIIGEEIPLGARIIAVADFFEAVTAKRHYRDPLPMSYAFRLLKKGHGIHIDEKVVDAFVK